MLSINKSRHHMLPCIRPFFPNIIDCADQIHFVAKAGIPILVIIFLKTPIATSTGQYAYAQGIHVYPIISLVQVKDKPKFITAYFKYFGGRHLGIVIPCPQANPVIITSITVVMDAKAITRLGELFFLPNEGVGELFPRAFIEMPRLVDKQIHKSRIT